MKSKIIEIVINDEYPKLMVSSNVVVLFVDDKKGTVVSVKNASSEYKRGEFMETWNMICFTHFHGTIELSNE